MLTASSPACFGQAGKAELFGTVQDPSSLTVKGAKVSADELATGGKVSDRPVTSAVNIICSVCRPDSTP